MNPTEPTFTRHQIGPLIHSLREIERMAQYTCTHVTCVGGYLERGMHGPDCPIDYFNEAKFALEYARLIGMVNTQPSKSS